MLGEDSGIEAVALDGAPGLHSARWAPGRTRPTRCSTGSPAKRERGARMVTELVAIAPDGEELRGSGVLEGELATERRGEGGFGYDPIFIPAGDTRTVAELGDAWKRRNSHRARAAQALEAAILADRLSSRASGGGS